MNPLYIFKPDKKSTRITSVPSVFHIAFIRDTHIYLEIFPEEPDSDTAIVTVFKNNKATGYGGTLKEALSYVKEIIQ